MPVEMIEEQARVKNDDFLLDYIRFNDESRLDGRRDCINLSIQRINNFLFRRFKERFERSCDLWCILEINPAVAEKTDVVFTIANAASSYVKRYGTKSGIEGLKAMFADSVNTGKRTESRAGVPENCPTSRQAEVLYPGKISTDDIHSIIVQNEEYGDRVNAALEMEKVNPLPKIRVSPDDFS